MPGLQSWNPKTEHLIRGLKPGQHLSGKQCFVAAGPPFLSMLKGSSYGADSAGFDPDNDIVYPIALLQTWALNQSKALSRLFEIGSERSYFATGHSMGQLSLSSILYHGPNLLKTLYAWFHQDQSRSPFGQPINSLLDQGKMDLAAMYPYVEGSGSKPGEPKLGTTLPTVEIPPGYENFFLNMASDLFDLPFGLLFLLRDIQGNNVASFYLEQCHAPNHQLGLDASGLIVQESTAIQYERMRPIPVNSIALLNGIVAPDIEWAG